MSTAPKRYPTPQVLVEHHVRQAKNQWVLSELNSLQDRLALPSVGCEMPLAEIYLKVNFDS